jgi:hypothetical protein
MLALVALLRSTPYFTTQSNAWHRFLRPQKIVSIANDFFWVPA